MEIFFFYLGFLLLLFSCIGHGLIFFKIFNIQHLENVGTLGLAGLANLAMISYISVFLFEDKSLVNVLILSIGVIFLIKNYKKLNFPNYFLPIVITISIALFISKTHDDFPFYHLQQSLNFSINKIHIGLSNLDFSYAYHSSMLYLNSIFYLPYFKYYFFNVPNLLVLIFFILSLIFFVFKNNENKIVKYFGLFTLIFALVKFSRLSEYGTDLSGQLIIIISLLYLLKSIYEEQTNKDNLKILTILIIFCITLKTYFIFYSLLILICINSLGYKNSFRYIKSNYFFSFYIIIYFSLFLALNIFSSGCLIFPIAKTCFSQLSWSMPINEVINYNIWFQAWSKSLGGAGYVTENYSELINNLDWIGIWYKNYFNKYLETLSLLFFISLILFFTFKPYNFVVKFSKNQIIIILFLFFVLLFWFLKHPTLRYGGYLLHLSLISMILSIFLSRSKVDDFSFRKKAKILILISISVFLFKNISRIDSEFGKEGDYNFDNFPYFYVKDVEYKKKNLNNDLVITFANGNACWASPPPCGSSANLTVESHMNFKIINRKD